MRWINLTIIVLFVAAAIIFAFEDLDTVSVSFLGFGVRAPMAILVSKAATGGSLFALLRSSYHGSRRAFHRS
jgi:uncharacterized integral membrane protein